MNTDDLRHRLTHALEKTRNYILANQQPDGTWEGPIGNDPRATAFYMNALWNLGRAPNSRTAEMERYLSSQQLKCGGWQAYPGSGPDVDVTTACVLALKNPQTKPGTHAQRLARLWLSKQPLPAVDSFWKGYLAFNAKLQWNDLPYLTPRIVSNPLWMHPNIYDFSFIRAAIVADLPREVGPPLKLEIGGYDRPVVATGAKRRSAEQGEAR